MTTDGEMEDSYGFKLQQDMLIKIINSYCSIYETLYRLAIFRDNNTYTFGAGNIWYSYDDKDYKFCAKRLAGVIEERRKLIGGSDV